MRLNPKWLYGVGMAVLVGSGVLFFGSESKGKTEQLNFPATVYGSFQWTETVDSSDYDFLAQFDVVNFNHRMMFGAEYKSVIDSVRVRNPDFVGLVYIWLFGPRTGWETSGGIYKELWDMSAENDWWLRDIEGNIVDHSPTNPEVWLWDWTSPGLADSLANIYARYLGANDNIRPHVGYLVDWLTYPYPNWAVSDLGVENIDPNQNGIGYLDDEQDQIDHWNFIIEVIEKLRAATGEPNFLIVPNGNSYQIPELAANADGGMMEDCEKYYPSGLDSWHTAIDSLRHFSSNERINPPAVLWHSRNPAVDEYTEAAAAVGWGVNNFQSSTKRLPIGHQIMEPVWAADTATVICETGMVRVVAEPYPWAFLVIGAAGDTLSRGGGWPREAQPSDLERILQEYTDYLSGQYGQPVSLDHISKWAYTAALIEETCDK